MQNSVPNPNKYTIGKYLKKKKNLRKKDPLASIVCPSENLQKYINYLLENGAVINKMAFSQFRLKNNLPYYGLITTDRVLPDEIVLKIPRSLVLNTKHAYFSEVRKIFLENPKFFSSYYTTSWEDHMLLIFLLSEYAKGSKSNWYYLILNLPRDVDNITFWTDDELKQLEDPSAERIAQQYKKEYYEDEAFVLGLAQKYPDILNPEVVTKENIQWLYIQIITRCFGKFLEYTTMVPFAELYNHECIDVYYDLEYYPDNPHKPADYSMDEPSDATEEQLENYETSDGTYDSDDVEFDSDFEYEKEDIEKQSTEPTKIKEKLNGLNIMDEVRIRMDDIENFLINRFDWSDGFSIFFVREIYREACLVVERYKSQELVLDGARNLLMGLETSMVIFANEVLEFYKKFYKKQEENWIPKQKQHFIDIAEKKEEEDREKRLAKKSPEELYDPEDKWRDIHFDNFVMKSSWKDKFEAGAQMFFCYGRLSNRCSLLRYGISLEYNKYEHVHFKIPYIKYLKDTEWLTSKIQYFHLSRYMRFKLRRTKVNIAIINFCKGLNFQFDYGNFEHLARPTKVDQEVLALEKACQFFEDYLNTCSKTIEENKEIILNPQTTYHDYFAAVYRLERQRIITFHKRAFLVLIEILKRLKKGLSLEFAVMRVHDLETEEECNRNRIFLTDYLELLQSSLIDPIPEKFTIKMK